jgi:hypothetical protein
MMKKEEKPPKGHYDLYKVVTTMGPIVREQRALHPKTKVWRDLLSLVEELREIQQDWAEQRRQSIIHVADNAPQLCASSSLIAAACESSLL